MADDELDAFADELVGDRDALLRIGDVVADRRAAIFWPIDAAGGVDVLDGLLGAVLQLRAEGGVRAGDRAGDADLDLRVAPRSRRRAPRPSATPVNSIFFMRSLLWMIFGLLTPRRRRRVPRRSGVTSCAFLSRCHAGICGLTPRCRRAASSRQVKRPGALVEPAVLGRHLAGAGVAVAERGRWPEPRAASTR